jgi:hypothetical protein
MFIQRNKQIAIQVLSGRTSASVAKEFGLSNARVIKITFDLCDKVAPEIYFKARIGMRTASIKVLRRHATTLIPLISSMH